MSYYSDHKEHLKALKQEYRRRFVESTTPEYRELLAKLRAERRKRKLSQVWMENYLYLGTGTFGYIERGQTPPPDGVLERWCEFLGVTPPD